MNQEQIIKKYKLDYVKTVLIKSKEEIPEIKKTMVVKAFSEKPLHKTERGLVFTNIDTKEKAVEAFEKIKGIMKDEFEGVLMQEQINGLEVIIGVKNDKTFGTVIAFGLGGIFVEVLKDIVFRTVPLDENEALKMIKETKAYEILKGARGKKYNLNKLVGTIVKISRFAEKEKIEADFNPVIVDEKSARIVDLRLVQ